MEMTKQEFIAFLRDHRFYYRYYRGDYYLQYNQGIIELSIFIYDKYFKGYLNSKCEDFEYKYTKANADKLIAVCNIDLEKYEG